MEHLCKFCQAKMEYVPLSVRSSNKNFRTMDVFYCYKCDYEYNKVGTWENHHVYKIVNSKMYRWSIAFFNDATARLWYVGEPGAPGVRPNRKMKLLQRFEAGCYPSITPQNIEQKLRFMLLFL